MRPGWGRVPHHPRRHLPQPAASPILPVQPRGRVLPDALLAVFPVVTGQAGARFQALAGDARVLQPKAAADRSGHSDNHLAGGCRQGGAPAGHHAAVHREGPQRARHRGQDPAQGELPARQKEPLTNFQTLENPSFLKTENKLKLKLLMEFNNSSYMPEIKAIVPPETPGTTSAAPIAIPFKDRII